MSKFVGNTKELLRWLEEKELKKEKRIAKKQQIINNVVNMLEDDICSYEEFIFDLVKEALQKRTNKELLEILK